MCFSGDKCDFNAVLLRSSGGEDNSGGSSNGRVDNHLEFAINAYCSFYDVSTTLYLYTWASRGEGPGGKVVLFSTTEAVVR